MAPRIASLESARAAGGLVYSTGRPCRKGHVSERYVSNRACVMCLAERSATNHVKQYKAAWGARNAEKRRAFDRENMQRRCDRLRARYRSDPAFALRARVGAQLRKLLKKNKKNKATESLLGYTLEELRIHIERQFQPGMSWENMGEWHIDHIIPISSFAIDGADDPELKRAWGLPNLRPLWAADNVSKSNHRLSLL